MSLNPKIPVADSQGVDLPVLKVYLAGRIAGNCIDRCLAWRQQIVDHYKNYKGKGAYPIAFLDALNSKESDSIDAKGLTSMIPPNLIYDKDLLSVEQADVVVANMDDFFEEGIESVLPFTYEENMYSSKEVVASRFEILKQKIVGRRANIGTTMEVAWALYLKKPTILIVPAQQLEIYEKHPFTRRASVIVTSVLELLEKKWLQILYKSIAGATY